jgi:hypothetical protein
MERFCAARFERGMGFGNRLFPWARCHLHSVEHHVPMLAPRWWWPPRVRPLLKELPPPGELPGHLYVRGLRALPEYIGGARRMLLEATSPDDIRVFRGEAGRLADLHGNETELLTALQRICTTRFAVGQPYVAMHVRRGDFSDAARTPLSWFTAALRAIRRKLNADVPALVVSDGSAADLGEVLAEPHVELVRTGVPLADLLVLSRARVLLASGSSFSAWAAFLGGMPAVTQQAHSLAWYGARVRSFLGHFEPAHENDEFLRACAAAF